MELGHGSGVERPTVRRKSPSKWRVASALAGAFGPSRNISVQEFVFSAPYALVVSVGISRAGHKHAEGYHYTHEATSHREPHERHPHERIMGSRNIL